MQVGPGISKAFGLVLLSNGLERGIAGIVPVGNYDALALGIIDEG